MPCGNFPLDVNAALDDGTTALHAACSNGRQHVADLLLERGADVGRADRAGRTALHVAVEQGHNKVATWLLEKGAGVHEGDAGGVTPLHLASKQGQLKCESARKTHASNNEYLL